MKRRRHSTLGQREAGAGGTRRKQQSPASACGEMDEADKPLSRPIAKARKKQTNSAEGKKGMIGGLEGLFYASKLEN